MKQTELCSRCGHELHKHSPACYQCQQVGMECVVFIRKESEFQTNVTRSQNRERKNEKSE